MTRKSLEDRSRVTSSWRKSCSGWSLRRASKLQACSTRTALEFQLAWIWRVISRKHSTLPLVHCSQHWCLSSRLAAVLRPTDLRKCVNKWRCRCKNYKLVSTPNEATLHPDKHTTPNFLTKPKASSSPSRPALPATTPRTLVRPRKTITSSTQLLCMKTKRTRFLISRSLWVHSKTSYKARSRKSKRTDWGRVPLSTQVKCNSS